MKILSITLFVICFYLTSSNIIRDGENSAEKITKADLDPKRLVTIGNASYYLYNTYYYTAMQAYTTCADLGMNAVSFETEEEWTLVKEFLSENGYKENDYWTSAIQYDGSFYWRKGDKMESITYLDWDVGQPDETFHLNTCISFAVSGHWEDYICTEIYSHVMCEYL